MWPLQQLVSTLWVALLRPSPPSYEAAASHFPRLYHTYTTTIQCQRNILPLAVAPSGLHLHTKVQVRRYRVLSFHARSDIIIHSPHSRGPDAVRGTRPTGCSGIAHPHADHQSLAVPAAGHRRDQSPAQPPRRGLPAAGYAPPSELLPAGHRAGQARQPHRLHRAGTGSTPRRAAINSVAASSPPDTRRPRH